mmetsp:Transcript_140542/g.437059  ORF Transcript_140542/g.437059 Transcript_140542/m.437059 type:complete len:258 (+) Transcript_140542:370-1143(+)
MPGKQCCVILNSLSASSSKGCRNEEKAYPPSGCEVGPTDVAASSAWVSSDQSVTTALSRRPPVSVCRPSATTTTAVLVLNLKPTSPSQSLRMRNSPWAGVREAASSAAHLAVKSGVVFGSHTAVEAWTRSETPVAAGPAAWGGRSASQATQRLADAEFCMVHLSHVQGPAGPAPALACVSGSASSKSLSRKRSPVSNASPSSSSARPLSWTYTRKERVSPWQKSSMETSWSHVTSGAPSTTRVATLDCGLPLIWQTQ